MKHFLIVAPRWLFLALLVFAPWAYGSVTPLGLGVLNLASLIIMILWIIGCAVRRTFPTIPKIAAIAAGWLFLQGWWGNLNAHFDYDWSTNSFVPIASLVQGAPGSADRQLSLPAMFRVTFLLGLLFFAADLSQRPLWRKRLIWTVALNGSVLILFGLIQRILGAPSIFWQEEPTTENFFATFYYHGNAGAFINLVLPAVGGLALAALRSPDATGQRLIWLPAIIIVIAGALATASKAAVVITLLIILVLLIWRASLFATLWRSMERPVLRTFVSIAIIAAVVVVGWFGWNRLMYRWTTESWETHSGGVRLLAYQTCLTMIPDAGAWGFGPGTFMSLFPHYTGPLGNKIEGFWMFAHEDYLQTLLEWGWIGLPFWGILLFGGLAVGIRTYAKRGQSLSKSDQVIVFTSALAISGIAGHALIDFPFQIASLQLYAALYLGILWGSSSWETMRAAR